MIYTATIRGYPFGCEQEWAWTGIPQFGLGQYRTARIALAGAHGVRPIGGDWGGAQVLSWPLEHASGSAVTCEQAAARLRAAFAPYTGAGLLELTVEMHTGTYVLRGRPLAPDVVLDEGQFGAATALVQFEATDPLLYSVSSKTAFVTIPISGTDGVVVAAGGVTVAAGGVDVVGGGSASDASVLNAGTAPAQWTAVLVGPLTNPRISIDGKQVVLRPAVILAGASAVVDSRTQSVTMDGQSLPWIAFESQWATLPPGVPASFSLRGDAGSGTATLSWQDASF